VIYRFDDHRYLELKGWNCEGALYYVDPVRGIRSEVSSQFYRAFAGKYVHPSERYIAIPSWDTDAFAVSKITEKPGNQHRLTPVFMVEPTAQTAHPEKTCSRSRSPGLSLTPPGQSLHELKALR
jgi:hypothetical protein